MDDQVLAGLASTFEVSTQALTFRLTNLGLARNLAEGGQLRRKVRNIP